LPVGLTDAISVVAVCETQKIALKVFRLPEKIFLLDFVLSAKRKEKKLVGNGGDV
jgi:hypothetical protein